QSLGVRIGDVELVLVVAGAIHVQLAVLALDVVHRPVLDHAGPGDGLQAVGGNGIGHTGGGVGVAAEAAIGAGDHVAGGNGRAGFLDVVDIGIRLRAVIAEGDGAAAVLRGGSGIAVL